MKMSFKLKLNGPMNKKARPDEPAGLLLKLLYTFGTATCGHQLARRSLSLFMAAQY
jgi:hypothetical protein